MFPLGAGQDPQPFADDAAFQEALKLQKEATPGMVIDLGNRRFAVDIGNGQFSIGGTIDGHPVNGMPKDGAQIPGLTEAIAAQQADRTMFDTSSGGGGTPPATPNRTSPATNGATRSGYDDGFAVASDHQTLSGGNKGSGGPDSSSGADETDGANGVSAPAASGSPNHVVKIDGRTIKVDGMHTFVRNQRIEKGLRETTNGEIHDFVGPNGHVGGTVPGRQADPPVDPNQLGKIQAVSNSKP
jgi:hypothetical protein